MRTFLLYIILSVLGLPAVAEQRVGLRVVELFTSQGCSSCPPADLVLGELRKRRNILPLGFHVDYWNYLGWDDPLSSRFATERQVAYREVMGTRYIYTPQFVVDGAQEFGLIDGSDMAQTLRRRIVPDVEMTWNGAEIMIAPLKGGQATTGQVWLVQFDDHAETTITSGENAGHTLTYHHPVRSLKHLGNWQGQPLTLPISAPKSYGLAVLVSDKFGRILGAADWRLQ